MGIQDDGQTRILINSLGHDSTGPTAPMACGKRHGVWYMPGRALDAVVDCVFVEHYFSIPRNQGVFNRIVPDNTVELIITDKRFTRRLSQRDSTMTVSSHFSGLKTTWQDISLEGSPLISIRFKADKIFQLTGIPAFEFRDQSVLPEDAFGRQFEQFEGQLFDQTTTAERLDLIHRFIAKKWSVSSTTDHAAFQYAKTRIEQRHGNIQLGRLCKQLNISTKTLENKFKTFLGLTPKAYCGLVRFVHCIKTFRARNLTLTDLAYASGYYDQAHMIRAFRAYTGFSPKAYFAQPSGIQDDIF